MLRQPAIAMVAGILLVALHVNDAGVGGVVWREHDVLFAPLPFTATDSCDALESKLRSLLDAVGARDVRTTPIGCDSPGGPTASARVHVSFRAAALAGVAGAGEASSWRPVVLEPHRPRGIAAGDCELVERFRGQVLPRFATRAVVDRVRCVPHQHAGGSFRLRFEVLSAPPTN